MSSATTAERPGSSSVTCFVCLAEIPWAQQQMLRWDPDKEEYAAVRLPAESTPEAYQRAMADTWIACPGAAPNEPHYLPLSYGMHGRPLVVGLVGESSSGKSHLLGAMVQAIDSGGLARYGLTAHPVDRMIHQQFVSEAVLPLFVEGRELHRTREQLVRFADAFVIGPAGGPARTVALFDVAGEELSDASETKQFLFLADALVFVVDPQIINSEQGQVVGDLAFRETLNLLERAGRLNQVSAAVVLNKSDLLRFDDPVAFWLRQDVRIDPELSLAESADVYAYLHQQGATAWSRPYRDCSRSTLHVASATGGAQHTGVFQRGVTPRRALGPLLSVLAMTDVITTPDARRIGR